METNPSLLTADEGLYTELGRSGLRVSRLALGTVNFGGRVDEPQAHRLMDHALGRGLNFVDTANTYGWRVYKGHTEEVVGRWLRGSPTRRGQVVLATKVGDQMGGGPNDEGLSARNIVAACEASLRRLRTDWIDVYQMHHVDRRVGWDEIWQAMELLVAQGKVCYVGSSNFAGWNISSAQETARHRGFFGLVSEQCVYNLVTRHAELEVIPAARAHGVGVFAWSPLHGGLLSGVLHKLLHNSAVKSAQGRAVQALEVHRRAVTEYERLCADVGLDPAVVGMAWALAQPGLSGLVIGPRVESHVDGAITALGTRLPPHVLARLEELFPPVGRGGQAPDAWLS
nr:aldo/keto reductase [Lentzea albidocapillata]